MSSGRSDAPARSPLADNGRQRTGNARVAAIELGRAFSEGVDQMAALVQRWLPSVIDGLEGFVRAAYEPGEGLMGATLDVHLQCASALLGAFELTGRLPYSMLAEEILQTARRRWWDTENTFCGGFASICLAVQVCCRLAALHRDADYSASAGVAVSPTYHEDATRMLALLKPRYLDHRTSAAEYGLALLEWFPLSPLPN